MVKQELYEKIQALSSECHQLACSLDIGDDRTEMFEVYGVLHNLTRRGYASQVGRAMNPLLSHQEDEDDGWDEDDD
ncbi:hypothetical protein ACP3S8_09365 [Mixta calida]|uniref:hypothetical protein n=1 Tax=Mixta calida TaxID=665913 RepID=UPI003CF40963